MANTWCIVEDIPSKALRIAQEIGRADPEAAVVLCWCDAGKRTTLRVQSDMDAWQNGNNTLLRKISSGEGLREAIREIAQTTPGPVIWALDLDLRGVQSADEIWLHEPIVQLLRTRPDDYVVMITNNLTVGADSARDFGGALEAAISERFLPAHRSGWRIDNEGNGADKLVRYVLGLVETSVRPLYDPLFDTKTSWFALGTTPQTGVPHDWARFDHESAQCCLRWVRGDRALAWMTDAWFLSSRFEQTHETLKAMIGANAGRKVSMIGAWILCGIGYEQARLATHPVGGGARVNPFGLLPSDVTDDQWRGAFETRFLPELGAIHRLAAASLVDFVACAAVRKEGNARILDARLPEHAVDRAGRSISIQLPWVTLPRNDNFFTRLVRAVEPNALGMVAPPNHANKEQDAEDEHVEDKHVGNTTTALKRFLALRGLGTHGLDERCTVRLTKERFELTGTSRK